jgi:Fe(3+) dicitrate transport protein
VAAARGRLFRFDHELEAGVRLRIDRATRFHTEESYLMRSGDLVRDGQAEATTRDETGSATALSLHVQDRARLGRLGLTAGMRAELIATELEDRFRPDASASETYGVFIPGAGAFYELVRPDDEPTVLRFRRPATPRPADG